MSTKIQWVIVSLIALVAAILILSIGTIPETTPDEVRSNQHQACEAYQQDMDQD